METLWACMEPWWSLSLSLTLYGGQNLDRSRTHRPLRSGPLGEQGHLGARNPRLCYYINMDYSIIRLKERCNNPSAICTAGYFEVSYIWKVDSIIPTEKCYEILAVF